MKQWQSVLEFEYEGNQVEEEVELLFEDKRQMLRKHFSIAYSKGNVSWSRGFNSI